MQLRPGPPDDGLGPLRLAYDSPPRVVGDPAVVQQVEPHGLVGGCGRDRWPGREWPAPQEQVTHVYVVTAIAHGRVIDQEVWTDKHVAQRRFLKLCEAYGEHNVALASRAVNQTLLLR